MQSHNISAGETAHSKHFNFKQQRFLTFVWYHDSASALLRLAMSSYWARTSATMASMSRLRLLSISTTTDVSLIWDCSSWISYSA